MVSVIPTQGYRPAVPSPEGLNLKKPLLIIILFNKSLSTIKMTERQIKYLVKRSLSFNEELPGKPQVSAAFTQSIVVQNFLSDIRCVNVFSLLTRLILKLQYPLS
jgi:hypothetical protein